MIIIFATTNTCENRVIKKNYSEPFLLIFYNQLVATSSKQIRQESTRIDVGSTSIGIKSVPFHCKSLLIHFEPLQVHYESTSIDNESTPTYVKPYKSILNPFGFG
jgi:hypothetical protein